MSAQTRHPAGRKPAGFERPLREDGLLDNHVKNISLVLCIGGCIGYVVPFQTENVADTFLVLVALDVWIEGTPCACSGDDATVVIIHVTNLKALFHWQCR